MPHARRVAEGKPKTRATRRARERAHAELVRDLERLARLEEGGSAARPIAVASPSQVDVLAQQKSCPLCHGHLRLEEHVAATVDGARVRVARMACAACGVRRALYFTLRDLQLH
jgi:hypothetical protein